MDKYYSDLARGVLSIAQKEIVKAQDYLVESGACNYLHARAGRLLRMTRALQDDILKLTLEDTERG